MNTAAVTFKYKSLDIGFSFLLCIWEQDWLVIWLDCLIYKNYQIVFQSSCTSLTIPSAKYWSSSCPTTSALGVACLLTFNHSSGCVSSLSMRILFAFSWWLMSFDPFIFHLPFVYFLLWLSCWWSRKPAWKTYMPTRTQLFLKWWFKWNIYVIS